RALRLLELLFVVVQDLGVPTRAGEVRERPEAGFLRIRDIHQTKATKRERPFAIAEVPEDRERLSELRRAEDVRPRVARAELEQTHRRQRLVLGHHARER